MYERDGETLRFASPYDSCNVLSECSSAVQYLILYSFYIDGSVHHVRYVPCVQTPNTYWTQLEKQMNLFLLHDD
jgi:hypothetical protein